MTREGDAIVHVTPGPSIVLRTEPDERPTRWCFECRKRVPHVWRLLGDPEPTYYEPVWVPRCPAGHSAIYFPGRHP